MDLENAFFVLEGLNSIKDAINLKGKLINLYFTEREILSKIPYYGSIEEANIYYITYKDMKKISNAKTPPGILGIFEKVDAQNLLADEFTLKMPVTLILDNIRDPGNMGTIIRTAAAFNISKIILTSGCVDSYNEKVIRASMSAFLTVPVFKMDNWTAIRNILHPNIVIHAADIKLNSRYDDSEDITYFDYYEDGVVSFTENKTFGLIIGGETEGLSKAGKHLVLDSGGVGLRIPMINKINSLNSAMSAGIILSEFQRRYLLKK